jgi:hypothetical protein
MAMLRRRTPIGAEDATHASYELRMDSDERTCCASSPPERLATVRSWTQTAMASVVSLTEAAALASQTLTKP